MIFFLVYEIEPAVWGRVGPDPRLQPQVLLHATLFILDSRAVKGYSGTRVPAGPSETRGYESTSKYSKGNLLYWTDGYAGTRKSNSGGTRVLKSLTPSSSTR